MSLMKEFNGLPIGKKIRQVLLLKGVSGSPGLMVLVELLLNMKVEMIVLARVSLKVLTGLLAML